LSLLSIFLISVGLAMDCFAVSVGLGFREFKDTKERFALGFKLGLVFGFFQAGMAVLGWILGANFKDSLSDYGHWIAFIILTLIGLKMMIESFFSQKNCALKNTGTKTILLLALATSIDALVIGVSFAFLDLNLIGAFLLIGFVSFILSFLGVELSYRFACYFKSKAEFFGGLLLILLGFKILVEYLYF
jgi:manganese efflux pump family protein